MQLFSFKQRTDWTFRLSMHLFASGAPCSSRCNTDPNNYSDYKLSIQEWVSAVREKESDTL